MDRLHSLHHGVRLLSYTHDPLTLRRSIILCLNAPEQPAVTTIPEFQRLFLSPGFLVWASLVIIASAVLIFYVAPRWGKT